MIQSKTNEKTYRPYFNFNTVVAGGMFGDQFSVQLYVQFRHFFGTALAIPGIHAGGANADTHNILCLAGNLYRRNRNRVVYGDMAGQSADVAAPEHQACRPI